MDVGVINDNSAQVMWNPPATLNGIVLSYHIYLYKVEDGTRVTIEEWELEHDDELSVKVFNLSESYNYIHTCSWHYHAHYNTHYSAIRSIRVCCDCCNNCRKR